MKKLLLLGAGGYGMTVADLAAQLGRYESIAFLDDGTDRPDVLGKCADYRRFVDGDTDVYPAFGNNEIRMKWLDMLLQADISVPALVHPRAYVSPTAKIGVGTVVLPMAVVNTGVTVKRGCIVNIGALIDHDSVIEDGVHLAPGAIIKAENRIHSGWKIEAGQVVENRQHPL